MVLFEKLTMRYAGWVDGRHGLLRCENGTWQSSVLKQEVDSYEEFCAGQMGRLKFEEEDELDHLDFYHRQDGNMSAHRADIQRILELMREKETVLETEHAHTQMLWNKCYGIKEKMEVVEDER